MPVTCKEDKRHLMAQVAGELDHHGARSVMEELDRRIDQARPRELTLDLSGLTFTDSSGIAVLLRTYRRMAQSQGSMRVVNTPAQAGKVFKAAGLERIIRFE
ncbi:MAG: anti-sigma factor antagonist [Lawsonibacter sp.]|jgi:stage II sporulation protein AA (anti-sigma F factor antagonist)|nr:anti-sigma factor antagonist [Lawsonibacter sp.]MCI9027495.1 anti-sigma factor antagonist [Lawsonibacter sp.]MCI9295304.1 anti-sigma factor antagonist [Lawsonibacter sp.]MCI9656029.1 anti-sigma factor antagonist [Lawsonibacter sp.]MDE6897721.1 anti-sigma factor antagonist [Lawsonibacter sp.]